MIFTAWLRRQVNRDDPIGDLARDFVEGARIGAHGRVYRTPEGLHDQLVLLGACHGAFRALDRAAFEWRAATGQLKGAVNAQLQT